MVMYEGKPVKQKKETLINTYVTGIWLNGFCAGFGVAALIYCILKWFEVAL